MTLQYSLINLFFRYFINTVFSQNTYIPYFFCFNSIDYQSVRYIVLIKKWCWFFMTSRGKSTDTTKVRQKKNRFSRNYFDKNKFTILSSICDLIIDLRFKREAVEIFVVKIKKNMVRIFSDEVRNFSQDLFLFFMGFQVN